MSALEKISQWPVDNVAGALIGPDGVETLGETAREYDIKSVTKPVVAMGIMLAVEEGAVELDQPAGPEGSTLRHLLAHASGVDFDSREAKRPVEDRRIYSSAGYEWAAEIVADAAGMAFEDYLHEGLLKPLGMNSTRLEGSAGHGLISSVDDLAKFASEVLNPQIIHSDTLAEMRTIQYPDLRGIVPGYGMHRPCPWGLGFEIHGEKDPHWMGANMPADAVGHFGMSGTYLWVAGDYAMVALADRDFGEWAKPLWQETNQEIWAEITA
ncbi:MAG: serine hydrolase domain-containing protein [Corynebacterium casei]|uniref:serine hydrolase domain-containing protein n=1 Tax=Corynebacterium casei TaxID=160386 RepID=UPI003F9162EF